jgi:hypothetical protein
MAIDEGALPDDLPREDARESGEFRQLLDDIEREDIPEKLLILARRLQEALAERRLQASPTRSAVRAHRDLSAG